MFGAVAPHVPAVPVSCLVCHRDVETALLCLNSLLRCARQPLRLVLHDDGSLTDEDADRLQECLGAGAAGAPTLIRRAEADARMAEVLRGRPASLRYRDRHLLALKLLDAFHLNDASETFCYCDSDILFLQPFTGLFEPAAPAAVFASDISDAYSIRYGLLAEPGLLLPRRLNTGVFRIRRACYDPDLVEWFVSKPRHLAKLYFAEQTCWALLAFRAGGELISGEQISVVRPGVGADAGRIALHYAGRSKFGLSAATAPRGGSGDAPNAQPPAVIQTAPMRRCSAWRVAGREVVNDLSRVGRKLRLLPAR